MQNSASVYLCAFSLLSNSVIRVCIVLTIYYTYIRDSVVDSRWSEAMQREGKFL